MVRIRHVAELMTMFEANSRFFFFLLTAIHMFFDCLALGVGLFASVMAKWPPNTKYSYG
jgi:Co/Zn/Cd efflux system component